MANLNFWPMFGGENEKHRKESLPQRRFSRCGRLPNRRQRIPMITQPIPQLEDQLATPDVQYRPHVQLPGLPDLRSERQDGRATGTRTLNIAFAGLQLLVGYEWLLAGLGLVTAGLVALLRPLARRSFSGTSATLFAYGDRLLSRLAPLAAIGAGLLGLSYFFLDGLPAPWFVPNIAFGGSIDTGLFFAAASVVLIVSQFVQRQPGR